MKLYRYAFKAMGGPAELRLYAEAEAQAQRASELAKAEIERLEQKFSRYRPDSVLSQINAAAGAGPQSVDEESAALLNYANIAFEQSGGLFDLSSGLLRKVWDFKQGKPPAQARIDALLPRIGWQKITWENAQLSLPAGMELDLGGLAKEYAVDAVLAKLREAGLISGLIDLAGDIAALGPHPDGQPWQVGIRHPRKESQAVAQFPLYQGAMATSGDYERYFIHQGRRFCHLLNPKTGWPIQKNLASVSVQMPQSLLAGTVSSIAMLMGQKAGLAWLREMKVNWLAVDSRGRVFSAT